MHIKAIIFDLGNTLIYQKIDSVYTLDNMTLELFPNAQKVLKELSRKYKIGLLSNTTQSSTQHVHRALKKLGISQYFKAIETSFDIGVEKPSSQMFNSILSKLNVRPAESLMVGNDFIHDIEGAHEIGMLTAYFIQNDQEGERKKLLTPDLNFRTLDELPRLIRNLEVKNE